MNHRTDSGRSTAANGEQADLPRPSHHERGVTFAIGGEPSITSDDALAVAELLGRRSSVAAATLARKVRTEVALNPELGEARRLVEPTRSELLALQAVLAECVAAPPVPAYIALLQRELEQTTAS